MRFFALLLLTLVMLGEARAEDRQRVSRLDIAVPVQMDYLLYLPKDYDQRDSWPLMLFLHGAGERGDDLNLVRKHGPPKLIGEGREFPFIVVSPQCAKDRWWQATELTALLDEVVRTHKVDADRIVVTGLSMGGFGTWQLAAYTPHRFAAIAPICGGGEKHWVKRFVHLPVWAFHGEKDTGVLPRRSRVMIEELKKRGGSPKLTIYPDTGHDAWTETYLNADLYDWLLKQERIAE